MIFLKKLLLLFSRWVVSDSFVTPWTVAHQAPLSVGFPRQGYWSGLSLPSPGGLPNPGMEPEPPAWQVDSLYYWATWEASWKTNLHSLHPFLPSLKKKKKNIFTVKNTFNWKKVHLQRRGKDSTECSYIPLPRYLPLLTLYTTTVHSPKLGNPQWHITIS